MMNLKQRAAKLKTDIPAVFLAVKDPDTPAAAKLMAALTAACALSPIDLIPDFIPVLGYLDDLILLPGLIALTIRLIPKDVWERSRTAAEDLWQDEKPKRWYYALPIVIIWLGILALILRAVL